MGTRAGEPGRADAASGRAEGVARPAHTPARPRGSSLRRRLSVSFAAIAVLDALVIGLVLLPILAEHYSTAERTYLEGAAERAVRDLAGVAWSDRAALASQAQQLALITQARVRLTDASGVVVADVPAPTTVPAPPAPQPLPNPLGVGLFGDTPSPASLPRSDQRVDRPVNRAAAAGASLVGHVELSEAPAYEQVALLNVAKVWALASLLGVLAAALVGMAVSAWLSRPVRALTAASDAMARGDLSVRADVTRDDELGRLAISFNGMASRVEATVTSLRRFVADAAHEIGTPLTALQADLELAEVRAQSPDERRLLGRAQVQADRLTALVGGLLRLSRLEAGDPSLARDRLDLAVLVWQVADGFSSRADRAAVDLALDLPREPVTVVGDVERLRTALANLVDNALKFTPPGGHVSVTLRAEAGSAVVSVADSGIGVPEEDVEELFDRFQRGRNASAYPGNGLGLAIVEATVALHGGSVRAERLASGTRFDLRLPLA